MIELSAEHAPFTDPEFQAWVVWNDLDNCTSLIALSEALTRWRATFADPPFRLDDDGELVVRIEDITTTPARPEWVRAERNTR